MDGLTRMTGLAELTELTELAGLAGLAGRAGLTGTDMTDWQKTVKNPGKIYRKSGSAFCYVVQNQLKLRISQEHLIMVPSQSAYSLAI